MRALFFGSGAVAARGGRVPGRFAGSRPALTGGRAPPLPPAGGQVAVPRETPCMGNSLSRGNENRPQPTLIRID